MEPDPPNDDFRVDLPQTREGVTAGLALHERLLCSALIAGLDVWIRIIEVIPERRRR